MKKFTDKINESFEENNGWSLDSREWLEDRLDNELEDTSFDSICSFMVKFAKLHVEKALEMANEKVIESDDLQGDCKSGSYNMKKVYPLNNIE